MSTKCNDIWNKVSNSNKEELDCEPVYNKRFLTKISSYSDETKDFYARKIPEADSNYVCWLVILIDSVLKNYEMYYLQGFLKERKYIEEEE